VRILKSKTEGFSEADLRDALYKKWPVDLGGNADGIRLQLPFVPTGQSADLIIVVRRGTGKVASATVHDPQQNRRPVVIDPIETGIGVGVQRGHAPPYAGQPDASQGSSIPDPSNGPMTDDRAHPQMEIGNSTSNDSLLVYRGRTEKPLDGPVVWRYEAKNALKPHTVPAVDAFRKAVDQAEQAAAKQP